MGIDEQIWPCLRQLVFLGRSQECFRFWVVESFLKV